ncbi:chemotaxis protein [Motilimonas pumila]|uniref:Chemotaxis signal transduction protein CheV n=1 Tax=Motilimonas pumila TaxID=2303987 RepID=A0A418YFC8_9GAMM|nr:chemotaxis protein [Motilimonas pumila]RJG47904.1 chemotaxis signal transduction protein CheV [Motilimonas pumila]
MQQNQSQGLLTFQLSSQQTFAIGTLKVQEIIPYKPYRPIPNAHPYVLGAADFRGKTIAVIDMPAAVGFRPIASEEMANCVIIVTDCSRQLVGFLVRGIDKISPCDWKKIVPPPSHLGKGTYMTGVTHIEDSLVQLLDVELLLDQIYPNEANTELPHVSPDVLARLVEQHILLVDDSAVARRQLMTALDDLGLSYQVKHNGHDAFDYMKQSQAEGQAVTILVSDIEMPGLDGYELTFEVRSAPAIADAYIILHTSLSSEISVDRAKQVGADEALTKFDAIELVQAISRGCQGRPSET